MRCTRERERRERCRAVPCRVHRFRVVRKTTAPNTSPPWSWRRGSKRKVKHRGPGAAGACWRQNFGLAESSRWSYRQQHPSSVLRHPGHILAASKIAGAKSEKGLLTMYISSCSRGERCLSHEFPYHQPTSQPLSPFFFVRCP